MESFDPAAGKVATTRTTSSQTMNFGTDGDISFDQTIRMRVPGSGMTVFNRYKLDRILGRGGMGVVWLADDLKLERSVALKFLPSLIGLDPTAVKELKVETRRGLELSHPHIVRIYDFVDDDDAAAISMEFVDGKTLSELRLATEHGVFHADEVSRWLLGVCDALDYAHFQRKLVHRDLKPANIMLTTKEAVAKIADFGIARSLSDTMSRLSAAHIGTSGTLPYMSPQQAMGDKPGPTDDVYSLGATIYELLSGKPPFYRGDLPTQINSKIPPTVSERRVELEIHAPEPVPKHWEEAIAACLHKDPAMRPQSAGQLAEMLGLKPSTASVRTSSGFTVKTGHGPGIQLQGRSSRTGTAAAEPEPRRSSAMPAILGAAAVVVLGAGGYFGWQAINHKAGVGGQPLEVNRPGTTPPAVVATTPSVTPVPTPPPAPENTVTPPATPATGGPATAQAEPTSGQSNMPAGPTTAPSTGGTTTAQTEPSSGLTPASSTPPSTPAAGSTTTAQAEPATGMAPAAGTPAVAPAPATSTPEATTAGTSTTTPPASATVVGTTPTAPAAGTETTPKSATASVVSPAAVTDTPPSSSPTSEPATGQNGTGGMAAAQGPAPTPVTLTDGPANGTPASTPPATGTPATPTVAEAPPSQGTPPTNAETPPAATNTPPAFPPSPRPPVSPGMNADGGPTLIDPGQIPGLKPGETRPQPPAVKPPETPKVVASDGTESTPAVNAKTPAAPSRSRTTGSSSSGGSSSRKSQPRGMGVRVQQVIED